MQWLIGSVLRLRVQCRHLLRRVRELHVRLRLCSSCVLVDNGRSATSIAIARRSRNMLWLRLRLRLANSNCFDLELWQRAARWLLLLLFGLRLLPLLHECALVAPVYLVELALALAELLGGGGGGEELELDAVELLVEVQVQLCARRRGSGRKSCRKLRSRCGWRWGARGTAVTHLLRGPSDPCRLHSVLIEARVQLTRTILISRCFCKSTNMVQLYSNICLNAVQNDV